MSDAPHDDATASGQPGNPVATPPVQGSSPNAATGVKERPAPVEPRVDQLPPYRVLLHNDDHNDQLYVIETLVDLTPLSLQLAARVILEANNTGVALVLVTHRERAELYVDQFQSKSLTVTIEPAE